MDELTKQEQVVLKLLSEGWNNAYIAGILFVQPRTVETHINSIFSKLQAKQENRNARVFVTVMYNDHIKRALVL